VHWVNGIGNGVKEKKGKTFRKKNPKIKYLDQWFSTFLLVFTGFGPFK